MKLCCGLMDGQLWDATLQPAAAGEAASGVIVVLSNEEVLSPQDAEYGEFTIAEATEEERRTLKQAGFNMPDWDPLQWIGCSGCSGDHAESDMRSAG